MEDGLPQNRIRAIAQTPDGYLWLGTSEGLARFDGVRFTVFDRSNTSALHDNGILTLRQARDGSLWIGTEGGGLVRHKGGAFQSFGHSEGLTNGFVRTIYEDHEKILWVGTDRGFFRLNGAAFVRLDGTPEIPLATVTSIAQDDEGRIWVNSQTGLLTVTQGKLMRAQTGCTNRAIRGIAGSRQRFLWTLHTKGISRMRNGCATPDPTLADIPIRSLMEDSTGGIWIGTAGMGLIRLVNGQLTRLSDSSVLPDNVVNAVFEDGEKNLWIGTDDGLLRLSRSYVTTISAAEGLDDDNVLTTYAGRQHLWIATLTGQIYRASGALVSRFRLPSPAGDLRVRTILEDNTGTMWFGTVGGGLVRFAGGKATVYSRTNGLRSNTVRQLLQDRSGAIWIGLESGLSRWDGAGFRNYYLEDGLSYPSTRCMIEDENGDILIGTDSGLNRVHEGRIVEDPEFAVVAREKIWSIYQDPPGTLWLGTRGSGLLRLRAGKVSRFTTSSGLPSSTIYQILKDGRGRFWMSTSSGIFSADPAELDRAADNNTPLAGVSWYGTADGMRTGQMSGGFQPAGAVTSSGDLWFPSVKGAVRINPDTIPSRRIASMLIERLVVDDVSIPLSDDMIIPPGHRKIEIDFTLCDLVAPQRTSFRYKLEGFDANWNSALRARSVSYTNLRPGVYRFRVRANDSAANASEATLSFTLRPEFYQTGWFYSLAALGCGAAIWIGMTLYARQTRARYALLMNERIAERSRLAREMHDTVIQGCVGVATLLEAIDRFRSINVAAAGRLLDDARAQITTTLEEARQAIWDLRYAPVANASITMLFDLARKLGEEHGVEIETEIQGKGEIDPETDRNLLLVGREALRNAVAHASPTRIGIRITLQPSEVILEVVDDGVGFVAATAPENRNKHFGIIGMRERVENVGGSLLVESTPGKGTRIVALLPLSARRGEPIDSATASTAR